MEFLRLQLLVMNEPMPFSFDASNCSGNHIHKSFYAGMYRLTKLPDLSFTTYSWSLVTAGGFNGLEKYTHISSFHINYT